jgi:hypothetical protein
MLSIVVAVLLGVFLWSTRDSGFSFKAIFFTATPVIHLGNVPVRIEVAETEAERTKGLSGRPDMGDVQGLLFIFPEADYHAMWMKDMKFAIDVIWISEDLEVVTINKNVRSDSFPKTFRPAKPAKYALETNAQFADTFGIREGMTVRIPAQYLEE